MVCVQLWMKYSIPFVITLVLQVTFSSMYKNVTVMRNLNRDGNKQTFLHSAISNIISLQRLQNERNSIDTHAITGKFVVMFDSQTWCDAIDVEDTLLQQGFPLHYMFNVDTDKNASNYVNSTLINVLKDHHDTIGTVIMFIGNISWMTNFMNVLCTTTALKWTHLLYTTEWILVAENFNVLTKLQKETICVRFVTVIGTAGKCVYFVRKSSNHNDKIPDMECLLEESFSEHLTKFLEGLKSEEKSGLEGFHVPVAFIPNERGYTDVIKVGNKTTYNGVSIKILDIFAEKLGFTYFLITPSDGGGYGDVKDYGMATGLTGLISRREAAFSINPMAVTRSRLRGISYTYSPLVTSPVYLTYRLPNFDAGLDTTVISIINTEFYLILLSSFTMMGVIGGLTHIVTKSCKEPGPSRISRKDFWRLLSFPDHMFFHHERVYAGHTGRILRASWGLFWVIFGAAYSAYLVTTFTVKTPDLKIDTLEKLLETPDYRFGVRKVNTVILSHFQHSVDNTSQRIWRRLQSYNAENPLTLSDNSAEQILRVLDGNYVLIDFLYNDDFSYYVPAADFSDIRSYPVASLSGLSAGYMAIPHGVFYDGIFNTIMSRLEEMGILYHLHNRHATVRSDEIKTSSVKDPKSVQLSRILLLVYMTGAGILIGFASLLFEILCVKIKELMKKAANPTHCNAA